MRPEELLNSMKVTKGFWAGMPVKHDQVSLPLGGSPAGAFAKLKDT